MTLRLEDAGRGHALARGARAVDRVVLLQQGRMVLQGPPEARRTWRSVEIRDDPGL